MAYISSRCDLYELYLDEKHQLGVEKYITKNE